MLIWKFEFASVENAIDVTDKTDSYISHISNDIRNVTWESSDRLGK